MPPATSRQRAKFGRFDFSGLQTYGTSEADQLTPILGGLGASGGECMQLSLSVSAAVAYLLPNANKLNYCINKTPPAPC